MKDSNKCPYCSAPLQENATFCLHCMKSLDSKTVIQKKKSKKAIVILLAVILILLLTAIAFLLLHINPFARKTAANNSVPSATVEENNTSDNADVTSDGNGMFINPDNSASFGNSKTGSALTSTTGSTQNSKSSQNGESTQNTTPESKDTSSKTDGAHTHNFTEKTVKSPTCADAGEKLYTCTCGVSYTEKISATGKHNFVAVTKTVHHDEVGHYENVKTADTYTWYKCPECNSTFYSLNSYYSHFDTVHVPSDPFIKFIREDYVHGTVPAQYEQKWIVDKAAYDEKIITGYKCSVCGKTK